MTPEEPLSALPCPFCGGTDIDAHGDDFRWVYAFCSGCGAQSGEVRRQTLGEGTNEQWDAQAKADAIAEWNRRALTERSAAKVEPSDTVTREELDAALDEIKSAPPVFDVYLDEEMSALLRDTIGKAEDDGSASAVRIQFGDGHDGHGLYVSLAEHPDEGSILLWRTPLYATPTPERADATDAERPMTLAQQVADAQREVASWSPEKRANVQLEGESLARKKEGA